MSSLGVELFWILLVTMVDAVNSQVEEPAATSNLSRVRDRSNRDMREVVFGCHWCDPAAVLVEIENNAFGQKAVLSF